MSISEHYNWLETFIQKKIAQNGADPEPLLLKQKHCRKVFKIARKIVEAEKPADARSCLLAALYHDIARFDQYLQYNTFRDSLSIDHGNAGVKLLKCHKVLDRESDQQRRIIYTAILLHNKRSLPPNLSEPYKVPTLLVRDADKLDILRILAEYLSGPGPYSPVVVQNLPDDPHLYSGQAIAVAKSKKAPTYELMKSLNDYRLLLGSWFYEMNLPASQRLYIEQGYGEQLIRQLPDNEIYGEVKFSLLQDLHSKI